MKKIFVILLALTLVFSMLAGCNNAFDEEMSGNSAEQDEKQEHTLESEIEVSTEDQSERPAPTHDRLFDFDFRINGSAITKGETLGIVATMYNVSGEDYVHNGASDDFFADVQLYCVSNGEKIFFEYSSVSYDRNSDTNILKNGENRTCAYMFELPENVPYGAYSIVISYGGEIRTFTNAFRILDIDQYYDFEKYDYSRVVIGTDDTSITPITCFSFEDYFDVEGNLVGTACGFGAYAVFEDTNADASTFPTVILDGEIKALSAPENVKVSDHVDIYDLDFQELEYSGGFDGLASLAEGEYVVVFYETYDSRYFDTEPKEYCISGYASIFRLIVPKESDAVTQNKYIYSNAKIGSGENTVTPIQTFFYKTHIKDENKGGYIFIDGHGVDSIFSDRETNPDDFPTLVLDGEVREDSMPVNGNISQVYLYDLDFQPIEYSDWLYGLSSLPAGEYIVVFREIYDGRGCDAEIEQYAITAYESLFRLVVPE